MLLSCGDAVEPAAQADQRARGLEDGSWPVAVVVDRPRLLVRPDGGRGARLSGRRHPPNLPLLQQAPQGGERGAKLARTCASVHAWAANRSGR
jgi:hypothetical protein